MKKFFSFLLAAMLCLPMNAIKVHTIGDSTMEERNPAVTDIRGWAQYLGSFLDANNVTVNNRGKSGADSRSFYNGAAYWPSVKSQMSEGDYLIIQFAHNDEGTITHGTDNLEYLAYCQTINPDTVLSDARGTNPQTTFRDYMRAYIDEARALGVTPILMAPICRAYFQGNTIKRNGQHDLGDNFWKIENGQLLMNQSLPANDSSMSYVHAMREVAKEKNVVFLDLTEETRKIYLSYESGEDCLNAMFTWKDDAHTQHDATHTSALGASRIALAAAQLMKNAGVLAEYITIPTDISVSPNAFEIGDTYCGVAQNKEFLITGYGLEPAAGNVALSATANLQISLDKTTYASTADAVYSGGSMFRKVYVRALYAEGGEQNDTVFVTAGERQIVIPFTASAISLEGGVDVSATWELNAKPAPAPIIEGPITADFDRSHMALIDYSSSKNYFVDGEETNIVLARFHNSVDGSARTPWPAGEIDENASRYLDFSITAPAGMDIRVSGIAMEVAADGTTAMNYHVNTGFGDNFTNNTTIVNKQHIANRTIEHVDVATTLTVPAGKTLHVRLLPWMDASADIDSKYIALRNVVISGKAFPAEENPEDQPGEGEASATFAWGVGNEAAPAVTSEKSEYVSQAKVTAGTGLTVGTYANYAANPGNTMVTYVPASSNAGSKPEVMIEYSVRMKKGAAFALKSVSYDALKVGTDGATYSWSYVIDGVESTVNTVSADKLLRNNNGNASTAQLNHSHDIDAAAAQNVALRIYVSGFANTKTFALSNVQLIGIISGEPEERAFTDFKVDFRNDPYSVLLPESGELPDGVSINATFHDSQHGINNGTFTIPVDGPVMFTFGTCKHGAQTVAVQKDGEELTTINTYGDPCDSNTSFDKFVTWTYNSEEAATLTFTLSGYMPYLFAVATEYIPQVEVRYYDTDGTTLLGSDVVEGGSVLAFKYSAADVTIAEGKAFRGWFVSADKTATKVTEGALLTEDLKLYARATDIEVAHVGDVFEYDLRQVYFYPEDHELLTLTNAGYKDAQHGWQFGSNGTISVEVAGNALVKLNLCKYGNAGALTCVDANNNAVGEAITLPVATDGEIAVVRYLGEATTLTFTLSNGGYVHSLKVFNMADIPTKNEAGYYVMSANDGAGLLLMLETAVDGDIIFLPNGTYDFGATTLTEITKSISLIGQSMEGVLIVNHPLNAGMNGSETLHLRGTNIYFQDLAVRCDVSYEGSIAGGVGIAVQNRGDKNIFKRVDLQGNQDTYLSSGHPTQRGWIEDCRIEGTVDYVCGGGNIWFENTLFFNNARKNADVIFAPNTDPATEYGYVLHNCTIDGDAEQEGRWNLARGWQKSPAVTFLNTTCLIAPSAQGYTHMGADLVCRFHEYNTHLEDGTVITGHNLDGLNYSTESDAVYLANEGIYTYANVIKGEDEWDAQAIAADAVADQAAIEAETAYLIENEGVFVAILKGSELSTDIATYAGYTMRKANGRGGFGQAVEIMETTGVENVQSDKVPCTKVLENGVLYLMYNGTMYDVQGHVVR